jgi:Ycf66 protein N-terminus
MVNVDFSPALVLGLGMVAGGVLLYNVRINRPWISRDYDVVISSISVLVGGILIFQVGLRCAAHVCRQLMLLRQCIKLSWFCRVGGWTRCSCLDSCSLPAPQLLLRLRCSGCGSLSP